MKIILLVFLVTNAVCTGFSQTKIIDTAVYGNWEEAGNPKISNDGKYVTYSKGAWKSGYSLVIKAADHSWEKKVPGAFDPIFTGDSRYLIFKGRGDSLCLLNLVFNKTAWLTNVNSYKVPKEGNAAFIAYQLNNSQQELVVKDLNTGKEMNYPFVKQYNFNEMGTVLLLESESNRDDSITHIMQWVNMDNGKENIIWKGAAVGNWVFDGSGDQLAFISKDSKGDEKNNTLWYYKEGLENAILWVNKQSDGMGESVIRSNGTIRFSKDGSRLFFSIQQPVRDILQASAEKNSAQVTIWRYNDDHISLYSNERIPPQAEQYEAVVYNNSNRVIRLTEANERLALYPKVEVYNEDNLLVWRQDGDPKTMEWSLRVGSSLFLVSTKDGSRKLINSHLYSDSYAILSPTGRYILYYDVDKRNYFIYDVANGKAFNATQKIPFPIYDDEWDRPQLPKPFGVAAWLLHKEAVLIYDRYDIWMVDPEGVRDPVNITAQYGRNHKIVLRLLGNRNTTFQIPIVNRDESKLLMGFNRTNKYNGFFKLAMDKTAAPDSLTMGPFVYHLPQLSPISLVGNDFIPIKARDATTWLVRRMSATEAPNYFITNDFKHYAPISNAYPQQDYNWMSSELVRWRMFDGKFSEGILYKPENFDPKKKYPVIYYFYERLSDGLNIFLRPEVSAGTINIPEYVSKGYLVFLPDIYYKTGMTGESVVNAVVSAARYLSKKTWVDSTKMGIQGHSLGGYEVNELITRTRIFAAAASSAGASDFISNYSTDHFNFEQGSYRIGVTPWQNPGAYIKNSPIFGASHVSTPLLILHNRLDRSVPFEQGIEFFMALRRLGKKVWLLQYDGEYLGHQLTDENNMQDYTTRLAQFFDHYLKGKSAPKWMAAGVIDQ